MSLEQIQRDQQQRLEKHLTDLGPLIAEMERTRDLAPSPLDRARYEEQIGTLKADLQRYAKELEDLEDQIVARANRPTRHNFRNPPYQVDLDDNLPDDEQQRLFRREVEAIATILDYTIDELTGPQSENPDLSIFLGVKAGDFNLIRCLFGTTCKIAGDAEVRHFRAVFDLNSGRLDLRDAILVTNTYVAPTARALARQSSIQILTFEELLDKVFQLTPYLKKHVKAFEDTDPLVRTYVDVRYLRRGQGAYPDARATREETLVTVSHDTVTHPDGTIVAEAASAFEAKGELTPYVDAWVRADGGGQVCLLGDYGTGKTSFAKHYFWHAAKAYLQDPVRNRIPLLVPLNRYHTSTDVEQMMTGFLVNECNTRRTFESFLRLAALGKFLVILDGFDEMAKQVDLNVRRRNFRELAKLAVGRNKVILSGRPNYFLTQEEIDQIFTAGDAAADPYKRALHSAARPLPRYDVLRLTLFDRWQIEEFLKNQSEFLKTCGIDDWRELRQTIARTYNLEELARTPVLLEIIIKTLSKLRTQVSEINAAKLYEIYTDHWLDEEYSKGDMRWLITRADKELFMLDLAWSMLTADGRPEIHFSQLSRRVQQHFELERSTEIEYFSSDIRFCSYLVHSETDGTYRFVHKSFMEYFCARHIVQRVLTEGQVATVATTKALPEEVFFFLCQLAGDEGVERLMELARAQTDDATKAFVAQLGTRMLQHFIEKDRQRGDAVAVERRVLRLLDYCTEFDDKRGVLSGLMAYGPQLMEMARLGEAEHVYERALKLARELDDPPNVRRVMVLSGRIDEFRGDFVAALRRYETVLEMLGPDDDPGDRWTTLIAMGTMHERMGNALEARALFETAQLVAQSAEDRSALPRTLELLAETYEQTGEYVVAIDHFRRAIALHRETTDQKRVGLALLGVANIYQRMGNVTDALVSANEALEVLREVSSPGYQASAEILLARLHVGLGEMDAAEASLRAAIQHSAIVGDLRQEAGAASLLGDVYRHMKRSVEALDLQRHALQTFQRLDDRTNVCFSSITISRTLASLGRLDEAREAFEHAVSALAHIASPRVFIEAAAALGSLSRTHQWWDEARRMHNLGLEMARRHSLVADEAALLEAFGEVETGAGDDVAADRYYHEAVQRFEELGLERRLAEVYLKRASLARARKKWSEFVEFYRRYRAFAESLGLVSSKELEEEYRRRDANLGADAAFDLSTPVQTSDRFWGRQTALGTVMKHVLDANNVAIAGDRRIGKTSLLHQVKSLIAPPLVPLFLNLQAFPAQGEVLLEGILREVVRKLTELELLPADVAPSRTSVSYASEFPRALRSILEDAAQRRPDMRLVLLLDDADVLRSAKADLAMREALTHRTFVTAVLALSEKEAFGPLGDSRRPSAMLDMFSLVMLRPLEGRELKDGLRAALARMDVDILDEALRLAYTLSGGLPWVAQLIGYHAAIRAQPHSRIRVKHLKSSRAVVAEHTMPVFKSIFKSCSQGEQQILRDLAQGQPFPTRSPSDLAALRRRGIVDDDYFRIASTLFEDWVRAHAKI